MGKADKELSRYIRDCLDRGYSFSKIEQNLMENGYSRKVAEGIILKYKYNGNILKWLTVSSLSILFIVSLFLSGSGIVGMVTVTYKSGFVNDLNLIINESSFYTWYPVPKGEVLSVAITGTLIGEGTAKIYIEKGIEKFLIFDSSQSGFGITDISSSVIGEKIKRFDIVCGESCELLGFNKSVYNLAFEVENAILEIETINFDLMLGKEIEAVPEWAEMNDQSVGLGSQLKLDLSSFFNGSSEDVKFRYLMEDEVIDISIVNAIATITPQKVGKSHLYFIADINGIIFMSNIVEVEIVEGIYGEKVDTIVRGPVSDSQVTKGGTEQNSPNKFAPILLIIVLAVILTLAFVPSRFYDMTNLAAKIDGMRKTGRISNSIEEYNQMKTNLKKKKLSNDEKEMLMSKMEKKIQSVSREIPKLKLLKEFNEKCDELEEALLKNRKSVAEGIYSSLRKIYLRLIEGKLMEKDKKLIYRRMQNYYNRLKK